MARDITSVRCKRRKSAEFKCGKLSTNNIVNRAGENLLVYETQGFQAVPSAIENMSSGSRGGATMSYFIMNARAQSNGDHEVHNTTTGCIFMPAASNRIDLGWYLDCSDAVAEAKRLYKNRRINGCYHCARACHTS